MKVAKEFMWEMGHRLPFHKGKCKNLHGHTYKLILEIEGEPDESGMVIDYYDVFKVVNPVIENLDHAFMAWREDKELIDALRKLDSKVVIVDFHSTAENICKYLLKLIKDEKLPGKINALTARVYETPDSYAEDTIFLNPKLFS